MPCYHPLKAWQSRPGTKPFFSPRRNATQLQLPCGQCIGCRLEQARQKAVRSVHEAKMHKHNCSITLTYNTENLPENLSLNHTHYQLFMKRLRDRIGYGNVRYMMCGEYGTLNWRPHYHAILYGWQPEDCKDAGKSQTGMPLWRSNTLDDIWQGGDTRVGTASFEAAGYIARYCTKVKRTDQTSTFIDVDTGEIYNRVAEYGEMSRRPGLGREWINKWGYDAFANDRVVVNGKQAPLPRYYQKILEQTSPLFHADNREKRKNKNDAKLSRLYETWKEKGGNAYGDYQRLDVEEAVKLAQIKQLKRKL